MNRGKTRCDKGSRETIGKGNNGIFVVRESYVYGGSVGNQGKRAAAMAWGRPRWSSVPVFLWR